MGERRRPLSVRQQGATEAFDALVEGVPPWMAPSLWDWVMEVLNAAGVRPSLQRLEQSLRTGLFSDEDHPYVWPILYEKLVQDQELFLNVVDDLLPLPAAKMRLLKLTNILERSGSAWKVADQDWKLERRVPQPIQDAADETIRQSGRAGEHLQRAWADIYGRNPDPNDGYTEAIKAVEVAAGPVVAPKDSLATLGKMVTAMNDKPSKWQVVFARGDAEEQVRAITRMMKMIWEGQHTRHGSSDESAPLEVTQSEAEAALHTATLLVHLFTTGAVAEV